MTVISFAWFGVKSVLDAGCHYDRETQSYTNFHNGWKKVEGFHLSDASGNALRFCWDNITHYKVGFPEDEGEWRPLNMDEINSILSNGEEWWKTAADREHKDGIRFFTRDEYSDGEMLGLERV